MTEEELKKYSYEELLDMLWQLEEEMKKRGLEVNYDKETQD